MNFPAQRQRLASKTAFSPAVQFPELDALRGIAMAIVFAIHAQGIVAWMRPIPRDFSLLKAFVFGGHTAPTLFFVLSAFLLARPFLAEVRGGRPVSVANYFSRRALRIVPLYLTAVLVATLVCAEKPTDFLRAVPYVLFLGGVPGLATELPRFSGPWWTVSTEVQFYLLLPLLPLFLRSRRGRVVGGTLLAAYAAFYAALWLGWIRFERVNQYALAHSIVGRGPAFLIGILAAAAYDTWGPRIAAWLRGLGWLARLAGDAMIVAAVCSLAVLLRQVVLAGPYIDVEVAWPVWRILEAALWATVLLLLVVVPMNLKPLLVNPAWTALGIGSYSVYLLHVPVLLYGRELVKTWAPKALAGTWTPTAAAIVAALALIIVAIACVTYRTIELPAMRRKLRVPLWTDRRTDVVEPTSVRAA